MLNHSGLKTKEKKCVFKHSLSLEEQLLHLFWIEQQTENNHVMDYPYQSSRSVHTVYYNDDSDQNALNKSVNKLDVF